MKIQAIIPAAGLGIRFNPKEPKTLAMLKDKPVFIWTLLAFEKSRHIESVILVVNEKNIKETERLFKDHGLTKVKKVIEGGATRYDSVKLGLRSLDTDTGIVVIHDAARPLIDHEKINSLIELCMEHEAVILAVPVKQTIKTVTKDLFVDETLNREKIWEVQTPQVFKRDLIVKAYERISEDVPTDDACLVERMGISVKVVKGDYRNIKITTREDLNIAEALIN